jgi:hypothetical protein
MKQHLLFAAVCGYLLTGCSTTTEPTPSKQLYHVSESKKVQIYNSTMKRLALSTKSDPNYQRIALDTAENKAWFKSWSYKLWDRKITKRAFINEGLKQYPDHQYEFEFIAEGLNLQQ